MTEGGETGGTVRTMRAVGINQWSGLSREVNLDLAPHRLMLAFGAAAGTIGAGYGWLLEGRTLLAGLGLGLGVAAGAMLAWVIGRELDPDHPRSAFLGMWILVPTALALGSPDLLLTLWSVLLLRCLNRTTGLQARPLDDAFLLGVSLWLFLQVHPALLALTGAILLVDGILEPGHRRHLVLGGALAVVGLAWTLARPAGFAAGAELVALWPLVVADAVFLLVVMTLPSVQAQADFSGERLRRERVIAAQVAAPLLASIAVLLAGIEGLRMALPIWSAMIGTAGFQLAYRVVSMMDRPNVRSR